jgi:hypothetical protein
LPAFSPNCQPYPCLFHQLTQRSSRWFTFWIIYFFYNWQICDYVYFHWFSYCKDIQTRRVCILFLIPVLVLLSQLCAKRSSRELMRDRNTYLILRELHKWEKDRMVLLACENVIDILIR